MCKLFAYHTVSKSHLSSALTANADIFGIRFTVCYCIFSDEPDTWNSKEKKKNTDHGIYVFIPVLDTGPVFYGARPHSFSLYHNDKSSPSLIVWLISLFQTPI